jgi:hypothetical protein
VPTRWLTAERCLQMASTPRKPLSRKKNDTLSNAERIT